MAVIPSSQGVSTILPACDAGTAKKRDGRPVPTAALMELLLKVVEMVAEARPRRASEIAAHVFGRLVVTGKMKVPMIDEGIPTTGPSAIDTETRA
jgi:hypothetical protein